MKDFIQNNKVHIIKAGWMIVGGLIVWSFTMGGIIKEHNDMFSEFPIIKSEQTKLVMNDTLMELKIQEILNEQRRQRKVIYGIANKLHVEIPAE